MTILTCIACFEKTRIEATSTLPRGGRLPTAGILHLVDEVKGRNVNA